MGTFVVTGHSRGLGRAVAERLTALGHSVFGISSAELDLSDPGGLAHGIERLLRGVTWREGEVAGLVSNAGTVGPIGPLDRFDTDEALGAVTLNLAAPLLLSAAFLRCTAGAADRRILLVSTGAARRPYAGWAAYCSTKAGVDHLARVAAEEGHAGLRVEAVAPGVVDTDMQAAIRATDPSLFPARDRFVDMAATGALSAPEEAARHLVGHLLSDSFGSSPVTDVRDQV